MKNWLLAWLIVFGLLGAAVGILWLIFSTKWGFPILMSSLLVTGLTIGVCGVKGALDDLHRKDD